MDIQKLLCTCFKPWGPFTSHLSHKQVTATMLRNLMHPSWGCSSQEVPTPTCWSWAVQQLWPDGSLCSTVGRICNGWGCLLHPRCLNKCNLKLPCQGDQHAKAFSQKCHQALDVGSGDQNLRRYLCELLIFLLHLSNAESSVLRAVQHPCSSIYAHNNTPVPTAMRGYA